MFTLRTLLHVRMHTKSGLRMEVIVMFGDWRER